MPFPTSSKLIDEVEDDAPRGYGGEVPRIATLLDPDRGRARPLATDFTGAAELTGLSRSALYQAAGRGDLPVHKWGARAIILIDDLVDYLRRLPLGVYKAPGNGGDGDGIGLA